MADDVYILGVSGGFSPGNHDPAVALLKNGEIVAAVEEERLIRIKHASGFFPVRAIAFCLKQGGISMQDVKYVAFHVDSYDGMKERLVDYLTYAFGHCPEIRFINHHDTHAACGYLISGFEDAMIITGDYSGDGVSTTLSYAQGTTITRLKEFRKPNSLGVFYALITQFLGFRMASDEYKVMGLASYGKPNEELSKKMEQLLQITEDGYQVHPEIFKNTTTRQQRRYTQKLVDILGKNRRYDEPITQREMDIAYAAQKQFEKACMSLLKQSVKLTEAKTKNLCLVGGATMNCVMNSVLAQSEYVDNVFVPPVAGDSGAALGAALYLANELGFTFGKLKTPYLGPSFSNEEIEEDLVKLKLDYKKLNDDELCEFTTERLLEGKIVGWFQGALEFGARALGNRSILANPGDGSMKDKINKFIKFRETFRPFAPSVMAEQMEEFYVKPFPSPYMTFVYDVKTDKLPATTHVDNTARVQSVSESDNPLYYKLLSKMKDKTGCGVVLNTSLNIMSQPIVCTPKEALTVFGATGMDVMVLGNFVLEKPRPPFN